MRTLLLFIIMITNVAIWEDVHRLVDALVPAASQETAEDR